MYLKLLQINSQLSPYYINFVYLKNGYWRIFRFFWTALLISFLWKKKTFLATKTVRQKKGIFMCKKCITLARGGWGGGGGTHVLVRAKRKWRSKTAASSCFTENWSKLRAGRKRLSPNYNSYPNPTAIKIPHTKPKPYPKFEIYSFSKNWGVTDWVRYLNVHELHFRWVVASVRVRVWVGVFFASWSKGTGCSMYGAQENNAFGRARNFDQLSM